MFFSPFVFTRIDNLMRRLFVIVFSAKLYIFYYSLGRNFFLKWLATFAQNKLNIRYAKTLKSKKITIDGINFRNDLGNAAGLDKDGKLLEFNYKLGAGFAVVGTALSSFNQGNQKKWLGISFLPWIPLPFSNSAINSLGLPSDGIDNVLKNIVAFKKKYPEIKEFPIGLSIAKHPLKTTKDELSALMDMIKKAYEKVDFFEINESCPNVEHIDDFNEFKNRINKLCQMRKELALKYTYKPIWVKLGNIPTKEHLKVFKSNQIDGFICFNTQRKYHSLKLNVHSIERKKYQYYIDRYQGGVSGKIIYQYNLEQIKVLKQTIRELNWQCTLIHVGGIETKEDILESRKIAPLRQWYTGMFNRMSKVGYKNVYDVLND